MSKKSEQSSASSPRAHEPNTVLGLDIGGTGLKAALVDPASGQLSSERIRKLTPQPSTPAAVLDALEDIRRQFDWHGPIGCGFPGLIQAEIVRRAPNLHPAWLGYPLAQALRARLHAEWVGVGNDADAAAVAEMRFGVGADLEGTVMMVTLGTGLGTAIFRDGTLIPNTELGHLEIRGQDAEMQASNAAREREDLSWRKWGRRLDRYLSQVEYLLGVDHFILGGGVSKKFEKFRPYLESVRGSIRVARMGNQAGICGAALFAADQLSAVTATSHP